MASLEPSFGKDITNPVDDLDCTEDGEATEEPKGATNVGYHINQSHCGCAHKHEG